MCPCSLLYADAWQLQQGSVGLLSTLYVLQPSQVALSKHAHELKHNPAVHGRMSATMPNPEKLHMTPFIYAVITPHIHAVINA